PARSGPRSPRRAPRRCRRAAPAQDIAPPPAPHPRLAIPPATGDPTRFWRLYGAMRHKLANAEVSAELLRLAALFGERPDQVDAAIVALVDGGEHRGQLAVDPRLVEAQRHIARQGGERGAEGGLLEAVSVIVHPGHV